MSVLLQTGKLYLLRKPFSKSCSKYIFHRKKSDVPRKFISFDEIVAQRRAEARQSLVVQVNSESSFNELHGYCSKYATINDIHHYKNSAGEHFMLIEFSSEENLNNVLQSCSSHKKEIDVMGVQSPFLWFRATSVKEKYAQNVTHLAVKDGSLSVNEDVLFEELMNCSSVSEQIQMLYDRTVLNDIGVRLRYMVARQLETVFSSLYANIKVQPFGSSVNGFGKMGCDLDLVLTNTLTDDLTSQKNRLVYQEKKSEGGRSPWQRHMELVGALLELRVPGATRVQKILNARVPIVKYSHDLADVDCDLCCNNTRTYPFAAITSVGSAAFRKFRGILYDKTKYFEQCVLKLFMSPKINKYINSTLYASPSSTKTLLFKFFEFYSQFEFQDKAISINEGRPVRKPNSLPLYVVNPLEPALNVSRNVSYEECERLRLEVRNAAWHLESCLDGHKSDDWGILGLIEQKASRGLKKLLRVGNSHRLVSMKDLFNDNDELEPSAQGIRSKLEKFKNTEKLTEASDVTRGDKKSEMKFKNSQSAREVYRIRRNKLI
ncbi:jg23563 [Pararge aegeria aegeria]|uniref:Jg23563 protein n=1 Tax=Pararge aegeria aegeria TaxID=348720 RepID=A0A8S4S0E5_9NEOP|nr:jg23563 [Pararge aegeria aegeria]